MRNVLILILMLGLSGCVTIPPPPAHVPSGVAVVISDGSIYTLSTDIQWTRELGHGIFRNTLTYTLLAGDYLAYSENEDGTYYRRTEKGIRRKNMGLTEHNAGGIFVPKKPDKKWGVWMFPNTGGFYVPISGGGVLIPSAADRSHATYLDPIPEDLIEQTKAAWKKLPNKT